MEGEGGVLQTIEEWMEANAEVIPNILRYNTIQKIDKRIQFLKTMVKSIKRPVPSPKSNLSVNAITVVKTKTLSVKQKRWLNEYKLLTTLKHLKLTKFASNQSAYDAVMRFCVETAMYQIDQPSEGEKRKDNHRLTKLLLQYDVRPNYQILK